MSLISPEYIILRQYDSEGNYVGPPGRNIMVNGEITNIDDWAEANGITLPDAD